MSPKPLAGIVLGKPVIQRNQQPLRYPLLFGTVATQPNFDHDTPSTKRRGMNDYLAVTRPLEGFTLESPGSSVTNTICSNNHSSTIYTPFQAADNDPRKYHALDSTRGEIRYIAIAPNHTEDKDSESVYSLGYTSLDIDDRVPYKALSYCRGISWT